MELKYFVEILTEFNDAKEGEEPNLVQRKSFFAASQIDSVIDGGDHCNFGFGRYRYKALEPGAGLVERLEACLENIIADHKEKSGSPSSQT